MNREQQEMALWASEYSASRLISREGRAVEADAAVAEFRKRYPAEPTAPEPTAPELTWHDEPPFPKDGASYPCWVEGKLFPAAVFWNVDEWEVCFGGECHARSLRGRRVCPIAKPQEPTTSYELRTSQYDHPDAPRGQHTNGPAKLFVRRPGGPWYRVRIKTHAHAVRRMIAAYGFDHFAATHCDPLPSEPPQ